MLVDTKLIDKICEVLDTTQCEFPRINVVMTVEMCTEEFEQTDLGSMIDTLGVSHAAVPLLHDLGGFRDRFDRKPGSDCWVPQSRGYAAAALEHANRA